MIPYDLFPALADVAREAVWASFVSAHGVTVHPLPEEVEHVHALVATGTPLLAKGWKAALAGSGISLRITGVFIHQTPKAKYDHPNDGSVSPELGDLLIVHEHAGARPSRRAALLQAKRTMHGVPATPDEHQEYLYRNWPPFELAGRGAKPSYSPFLKGKRNIFMRFDQYLSPTLGLFPAAPYRPVGR